MLEECDATVRSERCGHSPVKRAAAAAAATAAAAVAAVAAGETCVFDPATEPHTFTGTIISVKWKKDWYGGTVTAYNEEDKQHKVVYADGDIRWYTFLSETRCKNDKGRHHFKVRAYGANLAVMDTGGAVRGTGLLSMPRKLGECVDVS